MKQRNFTLTILIFAFSLLGITNLSAQSCFDSGTLLFREDFKGNNPSDPVVSPIDFLGGYSELIFSPTGGYSGHYALQKRGFVGDHFNSDDHTYPNDISRGYYMYIDPAPSQMDAVLYEIQIDDLCDGVDILLSVWAANLGRMSFQAIPKMQLRITDAQTNTVIAQSGTIILNRASSQSSWGYNRYTLSVTIPVGVTSLKLAAINKEVNNIGNDWAMDDIEIFLCTGPVNATANTIDEQTIAFTGNHTNTVFAPDIHSYWLYSTTGDVSSLTDWTPLDYKNGTCPVGSVWNHDFTLTNAQPGYYRLVVGNSNVLTSLCRAASPVLLPSPFEIITDIETDSALPVCRGKEIIFEAKLNITDMSKIESIKWDFGDGTVDEDTNPTTFKSKKHIYAKSGNYSVTATLKPKQQGGEIYLNSIKTIDIRIATCALPVNHNISVMGYYD